LEKRIQALIGTGTDTLHLCSLHAAVKHLQGTKVWTRACDSFREEVVCFVREKLSGTSALRRLDCSLR
jgi:hypothetical protein